MSLPSVVCIHSNSSSLEPLKYSDATQSNFTLDRKLDQHTGILYRSGMLNMKYISRHASPIFCDLGKIVECVEGIEHQTECRRGE